MKRDGEGLAQVHGAVPVFPVKKPLGQLTGYPVGLFVFLLVGEVHGTRGTYQAWRLLSLNRLFVSPSHPVAPLFSSVHSMLVQLWLSSKNPKFGVGHIA